MSEKNIGANISLGQTRSREEQIEFRKNQTFGSRLCEYITGIKPDDPGMIDRLESDQNIIRQRYNLPPNEMKRVDPREYLYQLKEMAKREDVSIRSKVECSRFFEEYSSAGNRFDEVNSEIFWDEKDNSLIELKTSVFSLEHELIHALQQKKYPDMQIELSEYEAYAANFNLEYLRKNPEDVDEVVFNFFIGSSVNVWYKEETGESFKQKWNTADWFLKNVDGIEAEESEIYSLNPLDEIDRSNFDWNRKNSPAEEIMKFIFGRDFDVTNKAWLQARLKFDHEWVREKCGLPKVRGEDLRVYIDGLKAAASERGIRIETKADYQEKYGSEMTSDGYCDDDEPLVFLKEMPEDAQELKRYVGEMEHELVHAWQVLSGRIGKQPQELMEYMALVGGNLNLNLLEENLDSVRDNIFAWGMINSLSHWYERNNQEAPWNINWWKKDEV